MKTKIEFIDSLSDNKYIAEAAKVINDGGLVAFPTETVYGLGANALDEEAVKKIFIAKGRPQDNPLIVHISCKEQLNKYVKTIPEIATKLIKKFWPGPLTIIFEKKSVIPNITSANLQTIGIRMPNNKVALKLIEESGVPIAAPSANISGKPSTTEMERCIEDFDGRIDYILGSDKSDIGLESTIIDITSNPPCILRPGGITLEMLREIQSDIYIDKAIMVKDNEDFKPKAPGMKYRHYAPKAKVKVVEGDLEKVVEKINEMLHNYIDEKLKVGIMATDETIKFYENNLVVSLGSRRNLASVAQNLFETLRKFDDIGVDIIISEGFDEKDMGIAIMNRLRKACGFDIIKI